MISSKKVHLKVLLIKKYEKRIVFTKLSVQYVFTANPGQIFKIYTYFYQRKRIKRKRGKYSRSALDFNFHINISIFFSVLIFFDIKLISFSTLYRHGLYTEGQLPKDAIYFNREVSYIKNLPRHPLFLSAITENVQIKYFECELGCRSLAL